MNSEFLEKVEWTGAALAVVVALLWAVFGATRDAGTVLIGAALGVGNFFLIKRLVGRFIAGGSDKGGALGALLLFKFLAVAMVFFLLVVVIEVPVVPLIVGVSLVFPAVMFEVLRRGLVEPAAPTVSGGSPDLS